MRVPTSTRTGITGYKEVTGTQSQQLKDEGLCTTFTRHCGVDNFAPEPTEQARLLKTAVEQGIGQGNESIAGVSLNDIQLQQIDLKNKEKKKFEAAMSRVIEAQRKEMLGQLDNAIGKLTKQIEKDQKKLEGLRDKQDALRELDQILLLGPIDTNNPEHMALLDRAGIEDKPAFTNQSREDQQSFVKEKIEVGQSEIEKLSNQIEANMDRLELLADAKERLENGADPNDVAKSLKENGITLEIEASDDPEASANNTLYAVEDKWMDIEDENADLQIKRSDLEEVKTPLPGAGLN